MTQSHQLRAGGIGYRGGEKGGLSPLETVEPAGFQT